MRAKTLSEEALAGLSAGIVGTVVGYPLDVIKTRMQTSGGAFLTTSIFIVRNENILSLYRGVGPPLISLSILNTVNFASYSYLQELVGGHRGWNVNNAIAGSLVGPLSSCVSTIENLVKTQLQVDTQRNKRQFTNSLDCITKLLHAKGPRILYTGHVINTLRESAFISTYFFVYEGLRENFIHIGRASDNVKWAIPVAGGLSGAIAWAFSFPLDLVRARIQSIDILSKPKTIIPKQHSMKILMSLVRQNGILGLYAGFTPSILRAFLVSGTRFSAYESTLWIIRGGRDVGRTNF